MPLQPIVGSFPIAPIALFQGAALLHPRILEGTQFRNSPDATSVFSGEVFVGLPLATISSEEEDEGVAGGRRLTPKKGSGVVDTVLNQKTHTQSQEISREEVRVERGLPLWKRVLDLAVILLFLPAIVLVAAIVALMVKCGSRGPVLFRQERVGYRGRTFTCFKFRTMHLDAETNSHRGHTAQLMKAQTPMTKLDSVKDPRIIPLGTIIRATGLDELPQLLNVLLGEMSLVGPRPCIPYEYEMYQPWQRRRFDATPGLTGLWQVSGKNRTTFNQMINLDIEYSERQNLWLDLKIMLKTLPALIIQCCDQRAARRKAVAAGGEGVVEAAAVAKPVRPIHV
jgi:exopolysaccharide production protein ExoY